MDLTMMEVTVAHPSSEKVITRMHSLARQKYLKEPGVKVLFAILAAL